MRDVLVDSYFPYGKISSIPLLLINDGQDLPKIHFANCLRELSSSNQIEPLVCVGIHAGSDRLMEYGTAHVQDFMGRGRKAYSYQQFVVHELLPELRSRLGVERFTSIAVAGFSLGGLAAVDLVWEYPHIFSLAAVCSGSFWWRSKDLHLGYNEDTDRILHQKIRSGKFVPGLTFYFTTGSLDETADRNGNGIIDSIDDTLALISQLKLKGYPEANIRYINYEDGKHDLATWSRALRQFIIWGWGI